MPHLLNANLNPLKYMNLHKICLENARALSDSELVDQIGSTIRSERSPVSMSSNARGVLDAQLQVAKERGLPSHWNAYLGL
jgi:hypothetical protein